VTRPLVVPNSIPHAVILYPNNNDTITLQDERVIEIRGAGIDLEDGQLVDSLLRWFLIDEDNNETFIGYGNYIRIPLEEGEYTILLKAYDTYETSFGEDRITFTIVDNNTYPIANSTEEFSSDIDNTMIGDSQSSSSDSTSPSPSQLSQGGSIGTTEEDESSDKETTKEGQTIDNKTTEDGKSSDKQTTEEGETSDAATTDEDQTSDKDITEDKESDEISSCESNSKNLIILFAAIAVAVFV
jgi:hypothetical protein